MTELDSPDPQNREASEGDPPSSGLARSIRDLFGQEGPSGRSAPEAPGDGPGVGGPDEALDEDAPETVEAPLSSRASQELRDRFTTRMARYLTSASEDREEMEESIRSDAAALRAAQALPVVADAIVTLTLHGINDPGDGDGFRLASELLDDAVANHLAVRMGTERDAEARAPLQQVAAAHSEFMAPALAAVLADAPDRGVRRILMDAIRALGLPGRNAVLQLMDDPRWFAVRNGIVLLSEMEDPEVVPSLTVPLAHSDPRVRKEAVMAIARIGGEDAGLLVLGMLEDSDSDVRAAAAMGVGELRVEKAQRQLQTMLEKDDEEEVQLQVLRALGRLGDPGAVQGIEKRATGSMFSRPPRPVRIAAYRALAAIGTPHARKLLEAAATDKDTEVREVVEALFRENPKLAPSGNPEA